MPDTIKTEAVRNAKLAADLDQFRTRYVEFDYENDINCTFPSGEIYSMEKNKFLLLVNSKKVKFQNRWLMRPDYVSYDYFGTTIYWPFILYLNNAMSIEDFTDYEEILIPDFSDIMGVIREKLPKNSIERIGFNETSYLVSYLQRSPLDDKEIKEIISNTNKTNFNDSLKLPEEPGLITSNVSLTATSSMVATYRLILDNVPYSTESIRFILNDVLLTYGTDYILEDQNVISWNVSDVPSTSVSMVIGDSINIVYKHKELIEYTHEHVLSSEDIDNQYLILPYDPINSSSIELVISGFNIPQKYGYDFILKDKNIISWSLVDCPSTALIDSLVASDTLNIRYLYHYVGEE